MPMPSKGIPKKPKRKLIFEYCGEYRAVHVHGSAEGQHYVALRHGVCLISSAASILAGMVAMELQVPRDVTAGLSMCWKSFLAAPFSPLRSGHIRGKAIKKYRTRQGLVEQHGAAKVAYEGGAELAYEGGKEGEEAYGSVVHQYAYDLHYDIGLVVEQPFPSGAFRAAADGYAKAEDYRGHYEGAAYCCG